MTDKVLFILAGYPGSGKTTLLANALRSGTPIFGREHDALFRRTQMPPRLPEWSLSFDETLAAGSWFCDTHLPGLALQQDLPRHVVLHVDLLSLMSQVPDCDYTRELQPRLPRKLNSLPDDGENELFMRCQLSNPFFSRFEQVIVNTVYVPWEVNTQRWGQRFQGRGRPANVSRAALFDPANRGGAVVHASAHRSWFRVLPLLEPALALYAETVDGRLRIGKIPPKLS